MSRRSPKTAFTQSKIGSWERRFSPSDRGYELSAVLHRLGNTHVGAAKAVDRLLVVTYDEQLSGCERESCATDVPFTSPSRLSGQVERYLRLQGICILELVYEDVGVASLEVRTGGGVVPERVPRPR